MSLFPNFRPAFVLTAVCCFFITMAGNAAEIKVDSLADSGAGSLREAVGGAGSGDVILIRAEGAIELFTPIEIKRDQTITGQGGPLPA